MGECEQVVICRLQRGAGRNPVHVHVYVCTVLPCVCVHGCAREHLCARICVYHVRACAVYFPGRAWMHLCVPVCMCMCVPCMFACACTHSEFVWVCVPVCICMFMHVLCVFACACMHLCARACVHTWPLRAMTWRVNDPIALVPGVLFAVGRRFP